MEQIKNKWVNGFIIGTFVSLYLLVSIISTIHVIDFFELTNPKWLAISLAIGFELGAAASLAALITLDKMNKTLVWALFITITAMQMQGNMYYAYINISDFQNWAELFNLIEEEPLYQKRVLSFVSGAILPLVALGFIKSLVDYIKPNEDNPIAIEDSIEKKSEVESKEVDGDPIPNEVKVDFDNSTFEVETAYGDVTIIDPSAKKENIISTPSETMLEKSPQTNIAKEGLITKPTEVNNIGLNSSGGVQRKLTL